MARQWTYRLIGVRPDDTYIDLERNISFERAVQVRRVLIGAGGFTHVLILCQMSSASSNGRTYFTFAS